MQADELALAREVYAAFAATGTPPPAVPHDERLRVLAAYHLVALGDDGQIVMAHPFAAHRDGVRVRARARAWWDDIGFT